jgi:HEAT repeat protein
VRASAAWALVQIGTERALEAAAEYTDDRAYIVETEARKAVGFSFHPGWETSLLG